MFLETFKIINIGFFYSDQHIIFKSLNSIDFYSNITDIGSGKEKTIKK